MVLRTTGASVLASIMRAERARRTARDQDLAWLLHGPCDPEGPGEEDLEPTRRLAAE